jgi:hypothetical protein
MSRAGFRGSRPGEPHDAGIIRDAGATAGRACRNVRRMSAFGRSETPGCRPQRPQPVCCGRSTGSSRRPLVAVQRSRERPLLRRAKGCNGGRTRPLNGKRCNFIGHCLSGPIPIRTNNPQNCGTRAVLRNETRARKSPKPACRLAPRPGLEPGTCGLTVRRSTN